MVAAHASSLFHELLIRLDLFCSFYLLSLLLDDDDDVDIPRSKLHCGQKSWTSPTLYHHPIHHLNRHTRLLGFDSRTSSREISSVRHPFSLSAACSPFLFFLSLTCLFFPFGALCVARPCRPAFIVIFGRTGERPSVNGVADEIAVICPSNRMRL
jgi:hypothetical protein